MKDIRKLEVTADKATCEVVCIHKETVKSVKKTLKSEDTIKRLSETFKALSDPTRAKIIDALLNAELCVCDLAHLIGLTTSAISHQLRLLRNLRIVKYRKNGKIVYYSLADKHIEHLFDQGLEHVEEGNFRE